MSIAPPALYSLFISSNPQERSNRELPERFQEPRAGGASKEAQKGSSGAGRNEHDYQPPPPV